jgi:hypothetical protein
MAWLVDADAVFVVPDEHGKPRQHFPVAIDIGILRAGQLQDTIAIAPEGTTTTLIRPCPRVFVMRKRKAFQENTLAYRGIKPAAAEALLSLAAAANNVEVTFAPSGWKFKDPAEKGVDTGWDGMKFIAAWLWSSWENNNASRERRQAEMASRGYAGKVASLYQTCRRMGLVTRSKP